MNNYLIPIIFAITILSLCIIPEADALGPTTPERLVGTWNDDGTISLSWDDTMTGYSQFIISHKAESTSIWTEISIKAIYVYSLLFWFTPTEYTFTPPTENESYDFKIKAAYERNVNNIWSPYSSSITVSPPTTLPLVVSYSFDVTKEIINHDVKFTWNENDASIMNHPLPLDYEANVFILDDNNNLNSVLWLDVENSDIGNELLVSHTSTTTITYTHNLDDTTTPLKHLTVKGLTIHNKYKIEIIQQFTTHNPPLVDQFTYLTHLTLSSSTPTVEEPTKSKNKGSSCSDCQPPWNGVDNNGVQRVSNGITINSESFDAGYYHKNQPMQFTTINLFNYITIDHWENQGPSNIKLVQLGSVKEIDSPIGESEWLIEVYLNNFKNDIENPTIHHINVIDPKNILDNVTAKVSLKKCLQDNPIESQSCLSTQFIYSFNDVPDTKVLVNSAIDYNDNTFNNYFNDGITVIDPNPEIAEITPPYKYQCKDKPLAEEMVPTRNNCNWPTYQETITQKIMDELQ